MRWDNLFDDLESQLEQEISAEELDLDAEEERLRLGRLSIRDRLVALHDAAEHGSEYTIAVVLAGGSRLTVHPLSFGRDWFSAEVIEESSRRVQCIVPIHAIQGVTLSVAQLRSSLASSARPEPSLSSRLGLSFVLRDLCRRRHSVVLLLVHGELHGTIDRVGRDHLDVAVHERGSVRRDSAVTEFRIVPLDRILLLRH
jgi:hypothetical protein